MTTVIDMDVQGTVGVGKIEQFAGCPASRRIGQKLPDETKITNGKCLAKSRRMCVIEQTLFSIIKIISGVSTLKRPQS